MYNKIFMKRSVIYTISKLVASLLTLLSISLFTRIFDAELYGNYLLFVSYVILICSVCFSWHRLSVYRYYHKYKQTYNSFLKTSYLAFCVIILILLIFYLLLHFFVVRYDFDIINLLPLLFLASIFKSNFDLNQNLLNISRKDVLFCINTIFRPLLFFILSLYFYYYKNDVDNALIYSLILSLAIASLLSNLIILKDTKAGLFNKDIIKKFYSYGFPLSGLFIFDYILSFSDRLMISHYLGSGMVGIYGANYDFIRMMILFGMIIQGYIIYPELNKTYEKKDISKVKKLFTFNINIFITIFFPLCIFIIYFNQSLSKIFIGENFTILSGELIPLFSIMFLFWGIKLYHIDYIFQLTENTSHSMYILLFGSLVNLSLNIYLIPIFKVLGAAYATLLSYLIILFISYFLGRNLLETKMNYNVLIKTIFSVSVVIIFCFILDHFGFNDFVLFFIFSFGYIFLFYKYIYDSLQPFLKKLYF